MNETKERDRAVIDMLVRDDSDFLSPFSGKGAPVISDAVADFLESSAEPIRPTEPLALHIYSDEIDEEEKPLYRAAVHRYYADRLTAVAREHRRNILIAVLLTVMGFLTIAASLILASLGREIWTEVIDIVAWVFCWEAVDIFFFKNHDLRVKALRYRSLSDAEITYFVACEEKTAV